MGELKLRGFLIICLLLGVNLYASNEHLINYTNINETNSVGHNLSYWEDQDDKASIIDIINLDKTNKLHHLEKEVFNRPATKSAFWFKITTRNLTPEDLWLEVGSNYAWYIDFYTPDSIGQYKQVILSGTMRPDSLKLYKTNFFWLPLNKANDDSAKTYYFKVKSGMTFEMPLEIGTIRSLTKNKDTNDFITAGFIGIMLIMFLYNLFIYLSTKDKIYIYYLGYILLMGLGQPYANGYPFIQELEFLFFTKQWWNEYFLFWHPITYFFVGEFCIRYLDLKNQSKKLFYFIRTQVVILAVLFPLLTLIGFQFVELVNYIQPLILLLYFSCLTTGFYFVYKKHKRAYFYVAGWSFMILGAFIFFGVINGVVPHNPLWRNVLYYGTAIEVWMFSLALGDRLNVLMQEKEQIKNEHFKLIEEQNQLLEQKVKTRTLKLEEQNTSLEQINEEVIATTEELDVKTKELEALNASKDRLFAVISHDLRSPIGSLHNLLELVDHNYINQEDFLKVTKNIKKDVGQLHFTLNNLLQWALVQMQGISINKDKFKIYDCIEENIYLLDEFAKNKKIEISNNCDPQQMAFADTIHFKIVLLNLLNNAIKFTPNGGHIIFSLKVVNDNCIMQIKDSGVGISEEGAKHLFLDTQKESTVGTNGEKGTGLGLILCKDFIEINDGKIWVESSLGFGTSFYVSLPISK